MEDIGEMEILDSEGMVMFVHVLSYQGLSAYAPEPRYSGYYVAVVIILVITTLVTIYHKQIVDWLTPVTRWLHE